jgi:hypothetical protein
VNQAISWDNDEKTYTNEKAWEVAHRHGCLLEVGDEMTTHTMRWGDDQLRVV